MPNPNDPLPTFFVIGGQRCGTTWLHRVLEDHPDVFVPPGKELEYFYRLALTEPWEHYLGLFRDAGQYGARGDMSVNYGMMTVPAIREVQRILPWLKLVLTIRNPVERSWSQLKLLHRLMTLRPKPLEEMSPRAIIRELGQTRVTRRSDYAGIVDRWGGVFGQDSLRVLLFEHIAESPRDYAHSFLEHIDVDPHAIDGSEHLTGRVHSGGDDDMPDLVRWWLSQRWREPVALLNRRIDGMLDHWVEAIDRDLATLAPRRSWTERLVDAAIVAPERVAYAAYDARRTRQLVAKLRAIPSPA